jgi:tetratricopeptide (TPR) repeat protein
MMTKLCGAPGAPEARVAATSAGRLARALIALACLAAQAAASADAARDQALRQAEDELRLGRRAEAARLLREAAERFSSVRARLQLARLQAADGDSEGALASLAEAGALAPNSEEVLSATAQVALGARRPLPAVGALRTLTRFAPDEAQYHYLLGVALMQAGDMPAACEALERAEILEPRALTLVALGLALNNRKLYDQARPRLERALELEPESLEAAGALAEAAEGLGELEAAEEIARRVLARDARQPAAHLVVGLVALKRGRYAEAREALGRALAGDPSSTKVLYQLSLADARLGDAAASEEHLRAYRRVLAETEERLKELRTRGLASGMGPQ